MPTSSREPPPRSGLYNLPLGSKGAAKPKSEATICTFPMTPVSIICMAFLSAGRNRDHIASIRKSFRSLAALTTVSASAAFMVKGFSQSTAFSRDRHSRVFSL